MSAAAYPQDVDGLRALAPGARLVLQLLAAHVVEGRQDKGRKPGGQLWPRQLGHARGLPRYRRLVFFLLPLVPLPMLGRGG